jgi:hypothetical protein
LRQSEGCRNTPSPGSIQFYSHFTVIGYRNLRSIYAETLVFSDTSLKSNFTGRTKRKRSLKNIYMKRSKSKLQVSDLYIGYSPEKFALYVTIAESRFLLNSPLHRQLFWSIC